MRVTVLSARTGIRDEYSLTLLTKDPIFVPLIVMFTANISPLDRQ